MNTLFTAKEMEHLFRSSTPRTQPRSVAVARNYALQYTDEKRDQRIKVIGIAPVQLIAAMTDVDVA